MKEVKEGYQKGLIGKMTIDPTMDERYGEEVLFQHKIDRLNALLKGTKFDPALSKSKGKS